ncbi:23S rRNA (guanosine(2251)-2'-O)-methyltransferase RlmB [Metamycoplasma auris]|uniref:23S rRNA (Guanosine2251-2'-O)-methyltransferase n=1 Tax=Metamycoplasma auris TaxID=51363 RepID=A0A2W7GPP1_9BACT|nr:23S rRNA (guanosine(2251)-2'-O)-methyltransferase RlmB [Metamycoplasma auris]PZV99862.1 23S rRNA (guanosine2251-2'-O)-methyltransferase [Metamycoplasma auris]
MKNYIYGKNSVLEALKEDYPIKKLYLMSNLKNREIKFPYISYLSKNELDKIVSGNHQGYIAEIEPFRYDDIGIIKKNNPQVVLILDHIQDPQNFGSILRSCSVFGVQYVIIPKDRSVDVTPVVLKTSSGGFKNIKIIKTNSLFEAIEYLKKNGFWIYGSALNKEAKKLSEISFSFPVGLIVGNEGRGVSKTLLKAADEIVYIEQSKNAVQSLNVSNATAIFLYEFFKQLK